MQAQRQVFAEAGRKPIQVKAIRLANAYLAQERHGFVSTRCFGLGGVFSLASSDSEEMPGQIQTGSAKVQA